MSNDQTYRALTLADYPLVSADVIRYADTDRQGHVNNAVFSTFLETGRTQFLVPPSGPL
ncbi:MAG: acyl-CoA thioesterase, partial [Pseudomonadota bacterium]